MSTLAVSAVLLVGGLGTRLQNTIGAVPKALAQVEERPWLEHQLRHLRRVGFSDVVLAVGSGAEEIERFVTNQRITGLRVTCAHDGETLVGTGGAIRGARDHCANDRMCVINGDTLLWGAWSQFLAPRVVQSSPEWVCTIAIAPRFGTDNGAVVLDSSNRVTRAIERAPVGGGWCSAGAYVMHRRAPLPPGATGPLSFENDWLPYLVGLGCVWGFPMSYHDIGVPERYEKAGAVLAHVQSLDMAAAAREEA